MRLIMSNIWKKVKTPLLILSAIIPLFGLLKFPADPLLPIYTVFVLFFLFGRKFYSKESGETTNAKFPIKFAFLIVVVGLVAESLAWGVNFLARRETPALFHPQLVYDLIISLAMYGAWAIVWFYWTRRHSFSLVQVFIIQGIYGVLLEQKGTIFIQGLLNMPIGILFWIYVFVVYGSITALAYLLSGGITSGGERPNLLKYALILLSLLIVSLILMIVWGLLLQILGIIPKPQPIWLHPLW